MGYVDYEYYNSLYGDKAIPEADFNRLSWEACRMLDKATTGIDNVRKLKVAFPTDEDDAETVRRCACKLIDIANEIAAAEERIRSSQGLIQREDGTVINKLVASVSAGTESVSYATGSGNSSGSTLIDSVLADKGAQEQLYRDTIREYLSGVTDANGVNLMYMGRYPYLIKE
uniref:Head tail connector protein n=1 Tax=Dulem virus 35 TaxID=3145753 RepID=A0AAU8B1B2_9CAUD